MCSECGKQKKKSLAAARILPTVPVGRQSVLPGGRRAHPFGRAVVRVWGIRSLNLGTGILSICTYPIGSGWRTTVIFQS